jgi:hypothetical protein
MDSTQITALTGAFDVSTLVTTFISLAPYVLGVAGAVIGVNLIKWGVRKVSHKLSGGAA